MTSWKVTRWLLASVWSGCLAAADGGLAPAVQLPSVRGPVAVIAVVPDWLWWPGLAVGILVVAGLVFLRRRAGRLEGAAGRVLPPADVPGRRLFDHTPVQILEEDWTGIGELFARLRAEGVSDMINHLKAHPDLPREWLGRVRLVDANEPAVIAAGFANREEMTARFSQQCAAPYLEVFRYQLGAIWSGRRLFQEEFLYRDAGGTERACLMQCRLEERGDQPDFSRVVMVLIDLTTTKRMASAQMENQELVRQILVGADILLWWAQVRRENGQLRWKVNVPNQLFDTPLLKLATAREKYGLWEPERVPDFDAMGAKATQSILSGSASYQNDFRVLSKEGRTHWVHENVGISRLGPDEWSLAGVVMDVTAQHESEEERRKSQAQLKQILTRADCMLWSASVQRDGDGLLWSEFTMPGSVVCDRLFGGKPPGTGSGLWYAADTKDLEEMNRRSVRAVLSGAPGYEQEFPVYRPQKTHWLHEQVSITAKAPDRWDLVGVLMDVTARHEADEARRTSEAQLKQLLTRADCMLWQAEVVENASGVLDWALYIPHSSLYHELFGDEPSEHPRLMWNELSVPELPEMTAQSTAAIRGGLTGYEQEFRAKRDDRTYFLHEQVSITAVAPGRWNLVGVVTDVTAARMAEEARRASEAQLHEILNRVDCLLWHAQITNVDGKNAWVFDIPPSGLNRRIFGGDAGQQERRDLYANLKVPELDEMYVRSAAALAGGAPGYEQVFRIVKPERTYWIHERVSITPQGPGRWRAFGVMIDISQVKEAEEAVRASEARYHDLFECAVEGVFQSTPEGLFVSVNSSLIRMFGCATREEFLEWMHAGARSFSLNWGRKTASLISNRRCAVAMAA